MKTVNSMTRQRGRCHWCRCHWCRVEIVSSVIRQLIFAFWKKKLS